MMLLFLYVYFKPQLSYWPTHCLNVIVTAIDNVLSIVLLKVRACVCVCVCVCVVSLSHQ